MQKQTDQSLMHCM